MKKFYDGQKLKEIHADGNAVILGDSGCVSIEVVMENGEMAPVAWAIVKYFSGKEVKWNLHQCLAVVILEGAS